MRRSSSPALSHGHGRAALLAALLLHGVAALSPNCTCAMFCQKTCAAENEARPEVVDMYRLTPGNVTGLAGKDTGDAAGDIGFFLVKLPALMRCRPEEANTDSCFLALNPQVRKFTVKVDGAWGPFMRCNPLPFPGFTDMLHVDTRHWGCFPWHGRGRTPWVQVNRSTSCADGFYCPTLMNASVGRDPAMHHVFDPDHPSMATYFGGSWFSTHADGECPAGRAPGDGKLPRCSWQLADPTQPDGVGVNASCMLDRLLPLVEANGATCFGKCPEPKNRTSACFQRCVTPSVLGDKAAGIRPIARAPVVAAWEGAFADSAAGGCAKVGHVG